VNSAVFSDGTFVYVPKGVRCPMELSTYFRINASETGQFERTLIIADEGAYVSYLEGCTAPKRDENQLHAAVVELVALEGAEIQIFDRAELVSGRRKRSRRHLQFRHQARRLPRAGFENLVTQVETARHHVEISKLHPARRQQRGRVSIPSPSPTIISRPIPARRWSIWVKTRARGSSRRASAPARRQNTYRGLVSVHPRAANARNYTQCDSLLIGGQCGAHTVPYIESRNSTARIEHEATTSKIADDQLFYCLQRGIGQRKRSHLSSTASARKSCNSSPWNSPSKRRSLSASRWKGALDERAHHRA